MEIAVIVEAILSFVDLSISIDDPTWGGMIAEGRGIIDFVWWVLVFPGRRALPDGARVRRTSARAAYRFDPAPQ